MASFLQGFLVLGDWNGQASKLVEPREGLEVLIADPPRFHKWILLGRVSHRIFFPKSQAPKPQTHKLPQTKMEPELEASKEIFLGAAQVQGAEIEFADLRLEIKTKKKSKVIMHGLSGKVLPGKFTALMGPSGSGKTSLLNALAGRTRGAKGLTFSGEVLADGQPVTNWSAYRRQCAYVEQDDLLFSMLTVRETLQFAADLRLPREMLQREKIQRVDMVLAELALKGCADTRIGSAAVRGVSGGERKRTSIAIEVLRGPSVLYLDECTTGLDSFQALRVATTIKELAMGGRTMVSSIHQPRSSIFQLFDDVLILTEGKLVYAGPANKMIDYFESLGHPMPVKYNPADFVLDLVSLDSKSESSEQQTEQIVNALVNQYHPISRNNELALTNAEVASMRQMHQEEIKLKYQATFGQQFSHLLVRAGRQKMRYKTPLVIGLATTIFFALLVGFLYYQTGKNLSQAAIQDKAGFFFFIVLNQYMTGLFSVLTVFPSEKAIIVRERSSKTYALLPYYMSKIIIDLPMLFNPLLFVIITYFLGGLRLSADAFFQTLCICWLGYLTALSIGLFVGAYANSLIAAQTMAMPFMLIFILFSGFYANTEVIPVWLSWIQWISPIKYMFAAMLQIQFTGVVFTCTAEEQAANACIRTGEDFMQRLGVQDDSFGRSCGVLVGMICAMHILAYTSLRVRKQKWIVPHRLAKPTANNNDKNGGNQASSVQLT
ncbi:hypothetical protein BASA81_008727 [Batrachochytrium salamandrivorans]|nr:hypothetical protein BASA81_008727 [Batrachochytrium salamandrivorans]